MKICVLMGTPHENGNTATIAIPFLKQLELNKEEVSVIDVTKKNITPCRGCLECQEVLGQYGCAIHDDMIEIAEVLRASECIVLVTPIYSWFCPAEMKAFIDRLVGMCSFTSSAKMSLLAGKKLGLLLTHAYDATYGAGPFELVMKRFCRENKMEYLGCLSVRDEKGIDSFTSSKAASRVEVFADALSQKRFTTFG